MDGFKPDKKLVMQIVVVLVALGFILESFAIGAMWGSPKEQIPAAQVYSGIADVNLTILDYRPYLYVDGLLNQSAKEELIAAGGVEEIIDETSRSVVSVSDSKLVPEIYSKLKRRNITSYTLATLSMPPYFEMALANGSKVSVVGRRFDYMMEPVSKTGGKVLMRLVIEAEGEMPRGIMSVSPLLSYEQFGLNASISGAGGKAFYYQIPWEERNIDLEGLRNELGEKNVEYARNNNVLLPAALTPQEMLSKKFDYVKSISERAITVDENFTDKEKVTADFGAGAVFMNSSLIIHSDSEPGLGFAHEAKYVYTIEIPEKVGDYNFYTNTYEVVASGERSGAMPVLINASILGETVMEIISVQEG